MCSTSINKNRVLVGPNTVTSDKKKKKKYSTDYIRIVIKKQESCRSNGRRWGDFSESVTDQKIKKQLM